MVGNQKFKMSKISDSGFKYRYRFMDAFYIPKFCDVCTNGKHNFFYRKFRLKQFGSTSSKFFFIKTTFSIGNINYAFLTLDWSRPLFKLIYRFTKVRFIFIYRFTMVRFIYIIQVYYGQVYIYNTGLLRLGLSLSTGLLRLGLYLSAGLLWLGLYKSYRFC